MRDGQIGPARIDIHGCDIDFEFRRDFFQIKPADSVSRESQAGTELHRYPFRIFPHIQRDIFGMHADTRAVALRVRMDFERETQFTARPQGILRSGDIRVELRPIALNGNPYTPLAKLIALHASTAKTKRPLGSFQIRDAHAGEQHTGKLFRRESYWNANHRAKHSSLAEPMPERRSASHSLDFRFSERQGIFADTQPPFRFFDLCRREKR